MAKDNVETVDGIVEETTDELELETLKEQAIKSIEKKLKKEAKGKPINFTAKGKYLQVINVDELKTELLKYNLMLAEKEENTVKLECLDVDGNNVLFNLDDEDLRELMKSVLKFEAELNKEILNEKDNIKKSKSKKELEYYAEMNGI